MILRVLASVMFLVAGMLSVHAFERVPFKPFHQISQSDRDEAAVILLEATALVEDARARGVQPDWTQVATIACAAAKHAPMRKPLLVCGEAQLASLPWEADITKKAFTELDTQLDEIGVISGVAVKSVDTWGSEDRVLYRAFYDCAVHMRQAHRCSPITRFGKIACAEPPTMEKVREFCQPSFALVAAADGLAARFKLLRFSR